MGFCFPIRRVKPGWADFRSFTVDNWWETVVVTPNFSLDRVSEIRPQTTKFGLSIPKDNTENSNEAHDEDNGGSRAAGSRAWCDQLPISERLPKMRS